METVTEETYKKVYKRDGGKCVICKSYVAIQLHHIHGRGPGKTNNPDNCVMLCSSCHEMIQGRKKFIKIFDKYVADHHHRIERQRQYWAENKDRLNAERRKKRKKDG